MTKCLDTTQQRLVLEKLLREKKQAIIILRQDSIIAKQKQELAECDEEIFVIEQKFELCADASKALQKSVNKTIEEKDAAIKENEALKEKARKNKKWKWIFGGIGVAAGVIIAIL